MGGGVATMPGKSTDLLLVPDGQFDSQLCHWSDLTSDLKGWNINIGVGLGSKHSHLFDTSQHMDCLLQEESEHWSRSKEQLSINFQSIYMYVQDTPTEHL